MTTRTICGLSGVPLTKVPRVVEDIRVALEDLQQRISVEVLRVLGLNVLVESSSEPSRVFAWMPRRVE